MSQTAHAQSRVVYYFLFRQKKYAINYSGFISAISCLISDSLAIFSICKMKRSNILTQNA